MAKLNGTASGDRIADRMQELGVSLNDMAAILGVTYEHMRRVAKGESVISDPLLKIACAKDVLDLDVNEMLGLTKIDRIKAKFGQLPQALTHKIPEMEPIERAWLRMSKQHRRDLINMAQTWAAQDKGMTA